MRRILFTTLLALALPALAAAQDHGFGLGVLLGEPTGISGKYWLTHQSAIDGAAAWSFRHDGYFIIHSDYLWHFLDAIETTQHLSPYIGIGGRLGGKSGRAVLGVRMAAGLDFWPNNAPIDVFLEIVPILDLTPATELSANGGIGVRFFFD